MLTPEILLQGITSVGSKPKNLQDRAKEFHKVTHLHLQQKDLTSLSSLQAFTALSVLYLYDNKLTSIEGLQGAHNLEILQLQRNKIQRITNLDGCLRLRKLYIGYNEIETIEGLENLQFLQELHVEHQRLPRGASLAFDPRSIQALANCLVHLNISGNNLTHLQDLKGLSQLRNLVAMNNPIVNLDNLTSTMAALVSVHSLDVRNAPVCKRPHFKERVISSSHNIVILNEKEIPDTCRQFLKRFAAVKATRKRDKAKAAAKLMEKQLKIGTCRAAAAAAAAAAGGDFSSQPVPQVDLQKHNLSLHLPGTTTSSVDKFKANQLQQQSPKPAQVSENPILTPDPAELQKVASDETAASSEVPKKSQDSKRPQFLLAPANFATSNVSPEDWATSASHRHGSWSSRSSQKPIKLSPRREPRLVTSDRGRSTKSELWLGRDNLMEGRQILKFVKPLSTGDVRADLNSGQDQDHDSRANSVMSLQEETSVKKS